MKYKPEQFLLDENYFIQFLEDVNVSRAKKEKEIAKLQQENSKNCQTLMEKAIFSKKGNTSFISYLPGELFDKSILEEYFSKVKIDTIDYESKKVAYKKLYSQLTLKQKKSANMIKSFVELGDDGVKFFSEDFFLKTYEGLLNEDKTVSEFYGKNEVFKHLPNNLKSREDVIQMALNTPDAVGNYMDLPKRSKNLETTSMIVKNTNVSFAELKENEIAQIQKIMKKDNLKNNPDFISLVIDNKPELLFTRKPKNKILIGKSVQGREEIIKEAINKIDVDTLGDILPLKKLSKNNALFVLQKVNSEKKTLEFLKKVNFEKLPTRKLKFIVERCVYAEPKIIEELASTEKGKEKCKRVLKNKVFNKAISKDPTMIKYAKSKLNPLESFGYATSCVNYLNNASNSKKNKAEVEKYFRNFLGLDFKQSKNNKQKDIVLGFSSKVIMPRVYKELSQKNPELMYEVYVKNLKDSNTVVKTVNKKRNASSQLLFASKHYLKKSIKMNYEQIKNLNEEKLNTLEAEKEKMQQKLEKLEKKGDKLKNSGKNAEYDLILKEMKEIQAKNSSYSIEIESLKETSSLIEKTNNGNILERGKRKANEVKDKVTNYAQEKINSVQSKLENMTEKVLSPFNR